MIDIPAIDMSLIHVEGMDVFYVIIGLLILMLLFLIAQLVITIMMFKNRIETSFSVFESLVEIIKKIKGKK